MGRDGADPNKYMLAFDTVGWAERKKGKKKLTKKNVPVITRCIPKTKNVNLQQFILF